MRGEGLMFRAALVWLAAFVAAGVAATDRAGAQGPGAGRSWWERYTPVVSGGGEAREIDRAGAGAARNVGYPAGWYGFWFADDQQRLGVGTRSWQRAGVAGLRRVIYYDSGEVGDYAVFCDATGRVLYNGWSLPWWKGEPVTARWFGLAAFMADVPWARWPTAKHYGLARFTAPDGSPAEDLYAVLARRNLAGQWKFDYFSNPRVTDDVARRSGLAALSGRQEARAEVAGKSGWQTVRLVHVDFANPQLREYRCRELAREITRQRPDGVHIDNHGDLNTTYPQMQAFGQWTTHAFREWLRRRMTAAQLAELGIADVDHFELRDHLRSKALQPPPQASWRWLHRGWTEDRLWNCYVLSTAEAGLEFHRAVYRAAKQAARDAGIDCLVCGNLVPGFPGHELLRGACDIAHFEWRTVGNLGPFRGTGLPPQGRVAYIVRLGAAISTAGYCWPSLYVPKDLAGPGHEHLHQVLALDCLANGGLLDFGHHYLDGYSPGTAESAAVVNRFVTANVERISGRRHVADVGLVYCPWSALASVTVARALPELQFDEYAGWATFLAQQRRAWDVVLSTELSPERLRGLPVLVLPSVCVLSDKQLDVLERYVREGGRLVATGRSGSRWGPERFLALRPAGVLASRLAGPHTRVVASMPGRSFWSHEDEPSASAEMGRLLAFDGFASRLTTNAPASVGVTLTQAAGGKPLWMLDLTNYDLDVAADHLTAAPACQVSVRLGAEVRRLRVEYLDPDGPQANRLQALPAEQSKQCGDAWQLSLPGFHHGRLVYLSTQ